MFCVISVAFHTEKQTQIIPRTNTDHNIRQPHNEDSCKELHSKIYGTHYFARTKEQSYSSFKYSQCIVVNVTIACE